MKNEVLELEVLELLSEICEDEIVKTNVNIELFDTDLLDSLAFAELLFEIEERFGVIIAPSEISREDINTPIKIVEIVRNKL